jgi:cytoskeleton protein RodZ
MIDTIGQRLKKAREFHHLTLEKAAEATRIRTGYLRALESDDFSAMPSPVQARGFLRNYAQYLDLDLDQVLDELRIAQPGSNSDSEADVVFEEKATEPQAKEDARPEIETEKPVEENPEEPFWQTWLRRVKSESGDLDEQESPASAEVASQSNEEEAAPAVSRESGPEPDEATLIEPITRPAPPLQVDAVDETGAGQGEDSDAGETESKAEGQTGFWGRLLEGIKSRLPEKSPKAAPLEATLDEESPKAEVEQESEVQFTAESSLSSQEIIDEIGWELRHRRELLSLSLDEIERHTRMRTQLMEALEQGKFDELPSPVQTRGMLANYAAFLDLDVDALLLRFADALQARHRERHPEKPARRRGQPIVPENVPPFRTFIAGDVIFGIGMVLLLVVFSVWGISRVIALQAEHNASIQAEATGPSISEALIGTPVDTVPAEVTLIPAEDTPMPGVVEATLEIPTLVGDANVQINVIAVERSFLRVTVDGEVVFEGRTIPGNAYPFEAEQSIELLAGNGSALRVIYNQRDMGLLGGFGQIASYIYTPDEILTPTPAVSPTATSTPFISPTPSLTPSPTDTPNGTPASPTPTATSTPTSESQ